MTINTILPDIRNAIADETGTTWDTDPDIIRAVNRARDGLWRDRPEAFWIRKVLVEQPDDVTTVTADLSIIEQYRVAIIHFAAYVLLNDKRRDNDAARAVEQYQLYQSISGGR